MQVGSPVCAAGQGTDSRGVWEGSSGLDTTFISENENESIIDELSL